MIYLTTNNDVYMIIPRVENDGRPYEFLIVGANGTDTVPVFSLDTLEPLWPQIHARAVNSPNVRSTGLAFPFWPGLLRGLMRAENIPDKDKFVSTSSRDMLATQGNVEDKISEERGRLLDGPDLHSKIVKVVAMMIADEVKKNLPAPETLAALTVKALETADNRLGRRIRARKEAKNTPSDARK